MKDKLYIFDLSNFFHRAFHAMEKMNLSTSDGFPTGAIYGTLNMFFGFMHKHHPENILICYDAQTPESIRKDIYPAYKANRVQVEAVSAQEMVLRKVIELLGMASVELVGYEADDLIASAVRQHKDNYNCIVVTGDKDLLQLIQPGVTVLDTMKNIEYDQSAIDKKFGVRAEQISDYLALVGDKVDNIPGVNQIGPVAAKTLLKSYSDIPEIYKNIADVDKKYQDKLVKGQEMAKISKELAYLRDELEVPEDVSFYPKHSDELIALLSRLEFDAGLVKLMNIWRMYDNTFNSRNGSSDILVD